MSSLLLVLVGAFIGWHLPQPAGRQDPSAGALLCVRAGG